MNFLEIVNAWITSFNPTTEQKKQSIERALICSTCPKLKTMSVFSNKATVCGACGCPISKKIFSAEHNPCPLKKWQEVDDKYIPPQKNTKTMW
jgi:hypothetical protein